MNSRMMNSRKFNRLVNLSMEAKGKPPAGLDDLVLNLGENGQITFTINADQPWTYTKIVHTELGSHPVMEVTDDFEDILDVITPYIGSAAYLDCGPFIEVILTPYLKGVKATASIYELNVDKMEIEVSDIYDIVIDAGR